MVHQKPKTKLTVEDYMVTSDDERWELLDGELIMPAAPGTRHQRIQVNLGWRLSQFVNEQAVGKVYFAPTDVVLSDTDVVQPGSAVRLYRAAGYCHPCQHTGRSRLGGGNTLTRNFGARQGIQTRAVTLGME